MSDQKFDILKEKANKELEELQIPESLEPENVQQMLKNRQKKNAYQAKKKLVKYGSIAAAFVLLVGAGTAGALHLHQNAVQSSRESVDNSAIASDTPTLTEDNRPDSIGDMFHRASSIDEVASALPKENASFIEDYYEDGIIRESSNSGGKETSSPSDASDASDVSQTNVQVNGIDEGDIIKTDGKYFYIATGNNTVVICEANDGELSKVSEISSEQFDDHEIFELYLDSEYHKLIVIATESTSLPYPEDAVSSTFEKSLRDLFQLEDDCPYYGNLLQETTYVYSIDINDPANPVVGDSFSQDGFPNTSRYVDGILYLFTQNYCYTYTDDELDLPCVDGESLSYTDCYLPNEPANSNLLMSAILIDKDGKLESTDSLNLMLPDSNIYMGKDHLYVMYESGSAKLNVAKFSYEGGAFTAVSTGVFDGYLPDTFAISENGDNFYLLLQTYSSEESMQNNLYVTDADLNVIGSITDIAPGENIYAARYIGDLAYFITYQQVDPLFVADLSDPTSPTLLGNVEISGYSEYLHPFGDGLMLGIGFETVDNGYGGMMNDTVKLVMFDVSDPLMPKVLDAVEIEDSYYTEAIYNYKQVLVNENTGLIGIPVNLSSTESEVSYICYQWNGSAFTQNLLYHFDSDDLASGSDESYSYDWYGNMIRGNYIDDILYISSGSSLYAFDMSDGFKEKDRLGF